MREVELKIDRLVDFLFYSPSLPSDNAVIKMCQDFSIDLNLYNELSKDYRIKYIAIKSEESFALLETTNQTKLKEKLNLNYSLFKMEGLDYQVKNFEKTTFHLMRVCFKTKEYDKAYTLILELLNEFPDKDVLKAWKNEIQKKMNSKPHGLISFFKRLSKR